MDNGRWLTKKIGQVVTACVVVASSFLKFHWEQVTRADDGVVAAVPGLSVKVNYPHRSVRRSEFGQGGKAYWLFEPAEPKPRSAPVVVLNHGWLAVNPGAYGAWISHLARSGKIVIFPRYQAAALTPPRDFLPNAIEAVHDALEVLDTGRGRVRPDLSKFALIGHSAGANLAAQMAAVAQENHLPIPRAVIAMMPGEVRAFRDPKLSQIPSKTLLVWLSPRMTGSWGTFAAGRFLSRPMRFRHRAKCSFSIEPIFTDLPV